MGLGSNWAKYAHAAPCLWGREGKPLCSLRKNSRVVEIDHHQACLSPLNRERKNYCLMARILLFLLCS